MPKKEMKTEVEEQELPHEKALRKAKEIRNEYRRQVATAIITALGLVIALAWKDVVTALMPSITAPSLLAKYPAIASLYSALIITVIAVVGIIFMSRLGKSSEEKK